MPDVPGGDASPKTQPALIRKLVVDAEVALDQHDRLADLPLLNGPSDDGLDAVHAWAAVRHVDADDPARHEDGAVAGVDLDLRLRDKPLLGGLHAVDTLRDGF